MQAIFPRHDQHLVPPDDLDDTWQERDNYCAAAKRLDRQVILVAVLDALASGESLEFLVIIDEACTDPHERPDEPRIPDYQGRRLGREIGRLAAQAVDAHVTMALREGD